VAAALGEADVRVREARVSCLRCVAFLAGSEVRAAGDGESRPGEVGRVERRPASMDVDALEEVVRMAEQALWRRAGCRLPRRAREPAGVRRREIDRTRPGSIAAMGSVTGGPA